MIHPKYKFLLLFLSLGICTCTSPEFPVPKDYPVIYNTGPVEINESGVTLTAAIAIPDEEELTEFGFLIQLGNINYKIPLEGWKSPNDFSYRLTSDLVAGQEYTFRPYANSANYKVTGGTASFVALGSSTAEILDFFPKTATIQTPITIIGKNFSIDNTDLFYEGNSGRGNRTNLSNSVLKGDVDTISFQMGFQSLYEGINSLVIDSDGTELKLPEALQLLEPSITGIDKTKGFLEETEFTMSFENFDPSQGTTFRIGFRDIDNTGPTFAPVKQISASETTSTFTTGANTTPGDKKIVFNLGPDIEYELSDMELVSRWEKVSDYPGNGLPLLSTVVGNQAFVLSRNELWVYDLSSGIWRRTVDYPENTPEFNRFYFSIGNEIFSGGAPQEYNAFKFNPSADSWSQLGDFQYEGNQNRIGAVKDNKYHMLSGAEFNQQYITYTPLTDTWTTTPLNIPGQISSFSGREPYFSRNGEFYFVPNPEDGNLKLFSIDLSGNSPQFNNIDTFSIPELTGSESRSFRGSAFQTDDLVIINLAVKIGGISRYTWTYNFNTGQLNRIGNYLTDELLSGFSHNGNAYGIAWNNAPGPHRGLFRFRKTLD